MTSEILRPAETEVRTRAVLHSIGVIILAFGTGIVLYSFLLFAVGFVDVTLPPESVERAVASSIAQFVGFLVAVLGYLWSRDDFDLISWGWPSLRQLGLIVAGFVGLYLLNFAASVLIRALGIQSAQNRIVAAGQEDPVLFLYMIPITVLLVAPGEELLFRGVVQGWFRRGYGPIPGIVLASLLFGGIHLIAVTGEGAWVYVAVAAALGAILGALYEYTRNLLVPIVVHGLWNTFLFAGQYLIAVDYINVPT